MRRASARIASGCILTLALAWVGCTEEKKKSPEVAAPPRASSQIPAAPLGSFDEKDLRALTLSQSPEALEDLKRALHGGPKGRRWAPLGLGLSCNKGNAESVLAHLTGAAAAWSAGEKPPSADHLRTLAWAIGRCGTKEAEDILRGWLEPNEKSGNLGLMEAGIFGLGALADEMGTLTERTQTAVLDAASRSSRAELMLPLGRLGRLSDAVGARILEVAGNLLTEGKGAGRRHVIYALGSAGPSAAAPLAQVLKESAFSPEERAAAAQALGRLGEQGQQALDESLGVLLARGLPMEFDQPLWIPLRATLTTLTKAKESKKKLRELSSVVLPEGDEREKKGQRRRLVWLRCQAAQLLAQGRAEWTPLLECDPKKGRDFLLAQLEVLGRERLEKHRLELFVERVKSKDPVVTQAALRMIPGHPEIGTSPSLLLAALGSASPGTVATAAQVIAAYPTRAHGKDGSAEKIVAQLSKLLEKSAQQLPAETIAAVIKAGGALGALSLKPLIEKACSGPAQSLWDPARQALALLGSPQAKCPEKRSGLALGDGKAVTATLIIDSDVGQLKLHLEGKDAPESAAHFLNLVDAGFYDGMAVHAMRAGFAVQFGDKDGDGYQDAPSALLPHEISPEPFSALTFGMSAFSPGSQDSQIFVVVSDAPQLTASRVRLGRAEGPWHLLVVGDVLHSVKRSR